MRLIKEVTAEKLRGGFYTPAPIASFVLKWAVNGNKDQSILEPSCGDGAFLRRIAEEKYEFRSLTAIELNRAEYNKAKKISLPNCNLINADFYKFFSKTRERFDVVMGNPPFIRYQYFNKEQQLGAAHIFGRAGLKYSKLTNSWVSFVVGSSLLLKEEGRIAFVVPAEILQVSHAKMLRQFLVNFFNKINIISFQKLVFPEIQQEVVLLLCEKDRSHTNAIDHIEVEDINHLMKLDVNKLHYPKKRVDFHSNKWTFYFLDQLEIDFLENLTNSSSISLLGKFADVEVGITTGANPFFTVPLSTVVEYNLFDYARPLVGRSVQVSSAIFTKKDWEINRKNEARTHLLVFPEKSKMKGNKAALSYLNFGERHKIDEGYKCSIRDEWQMIPSIRFSDALFIRRNNLFPRLIINDAKAYTTDTMHRVNVKKGTDLAAFTASYYNSLSFAFAEIRGRSHGGGVLELMPNEAEDILLPYHAANGELLDFIDSSFRNKVDISNILRHTNKIILQKRYGMSESDIKIADSIWRKLLNRRLSRANRSFANE